MRHGVIGRGCLDDAGQERGLRRGRVLCVLVEICASRSAEAVGAVAKVHPIQIHAEDLVFRVALLERDRKHHLLDLSREGFLWREELDLDQLLRDGAGAFVEAPRRDVHPRRPRDRRRVERTVVVEVAVLGSEDALGRVRPHLLQRQGDVIVACRAPILDELAVSVEHHDIARGKHVLTRVRQVLDRPQHVEGRGEEQHADRGGDPHLLCPQPGKWSE